MKTVLIVIGTRPEGIKLAPVYNALKNYPEINVEVCTTAQHREMLDDVLELFSIKPDYDLSVMKDDQDLYYITSEILNKMKDVYNKSKPEMVIVQGDTTTTFAASLAAFYKKIKIAHVEAGLRTGNLSSPFPEEMNRCLTDKISDLQFAPTKISEKNLINEGSPSEAVYVTGNTVVDALHFIREKTKGVHFEDISNEDTKNILVTAHRRENHGQSIQEICFAINELAQKNTDWTFFWPVHPSPNIKNVVYTEIRDLNNIKLLKPLRYDAFVNLLFKSSLIITDSGGVQEEAASIGKPVLIMREYTERMEAVLEGSAKLIEVNKQSIISEVSKYMNKSKTPIVNDSIYGDGNAAIKIADKIKSVIN